MLVEFAIHKPEIKKILLNKKIKKINLENCPCCKSKNIEYLFKIGKKQESIKLSICKICGHIFYSDFFDDEFLDTYYKDHFSSSRVLSNNKALELYKNVSNSNHASKLYYSINNFIKNAKEKHILEIGCGNGQSLMYLKSKGYKNLYGNEMNNSRVINSRMFLPDTIYEGGFKKIPNIKFDIIYANHVFEHIFDLQGLFRKIDQLSKNDTVIVINVPNEKYESIFNKIFFIGHAHSFNYNSLIMLAKEFGFLSKVLEPLRKDEIRIVLSKNKEILNKYRTLENIKIDNPINIKNRILKPFINLKLNKKNNFTTDRTARYNNYSLNRREDTYLEFNQFLKICLLITLYLYIFGIKLNSNFIKRIADYIIKIISNRKILHQGFVTLKLINKYYEKKLNLPINLISRNNYVEAK